MHDCAHLTTHSTPFITHTTLLRIDLGNKKSSSSREDPSATTLRMLAMRIVAVVLIQGCGAILAPQGPKPALVKPQPAPGTAGLVSPAGFEECYNTLRELKAKNGSPLIHIKQVEKAAPETAEKLRRRVNFDVPTTPAAAIATFFGHPTARFISAALLLSLVGRLMIGTALAWADLAACTATGLFWCIQEWVIHDKLLHSSFIWFGECVHRWHHELPYYHVSLDGLGLAGAWFSVAAVLFIGVGTLTRTLAPTLSALATYTLFGGLYEASHYLAHTRVPLPKYLEGMRRHHTRHHLVSDEFWLAFTIPAVDTLFGTAPNVQDVSKANRRLAAAMKETRRRRSGGDVQMSGAHVVRRRWWWSRALMLFSAPLVAMEGATVAKAETGLGYVDNAGMTSYSSVQRAWEKSATMSQREIALVARGVDPEADLNALSDKGRKRAAMAGCKDELFRKAAGYDSEASCNGRVMGGDVQFMIDAMMRKAP